MQDPLRLDMAVLAPSHFVAYVPTVVAPISKEFLHMFNPIKPCTKSDRFHMNFGLHNKVTGALRWVAVSVYTGR